MMKIIIIIIIKVVLYTDRTKNPKSTPHTYYCDLYVNTINRKLLLYSFRNTIFVYLNSMYFIPFFSKTCKYYLFFLCRLSLLYTMILAECILKDNCSAMINSAAFLDQTTPVDNMSYKVSPFDNPFTNSLGYIIMH